METILSYREESYDPADDSVVVAETGKDISGRSWGKEIATWCLYLIAALAPIFFLSLTPSAVYAKEMIISLLALVALLGWCASFLSSGTFRYVHTITNSAIAVFLAILFVSTILSKNFFTSLWGADATGEKLLSWIVFALVYVLIGSLIDRKKTSGMIALFFLSSTLLGLMTLLQLFGVNVFSWFGIAGSQFNPIGTMNALSVFYGFIAVLGVGILSHLKKFSGGETYIERWFRYAVFSGGGLAFLNMLFINLQVLWIAFAAGMVILLGFNFKSAFSERREGGAPVLGGASFYLPLFLLIISVLLYLVSGPLFGIAVNVAPEISPSASATWDIAKAALKDRLFFGSGPATFLLDYNLFRDSALNQTDFWAVKFFHGSSFVLTSLATTGIVGVLALLALVVMTLIGFVRAMFRDARIDPVRLAIFAALVFGFVMWALYASTWTSNLLLFMFAGLFLARHSHEGAHEEDISWWRIHPRAIGISSPSFMFVASLASIFLMVLGVIGIYYVSQKYVAEVYFARGLAVANSGGDLEQAQSFFSRASRIDGKDDRYVRAEAQILFARLQGVIQQAATRQDPALQQSFQSLLSQAIDRARLAQSLNPGDPQNWSTLALVYEAVIPYVEGSDKFSIDSYDAASKFDPLNPAFFFDSGRIRVGIGDFMFVRANNASGEARSAMLRDRDALLVQAQEKFEEALRLKPDYAPAHFLLAQVFDRKGDLNSAIRSAENTRILAFQDVGVAFQLGFLYYKADRLANAAQEFERAVSLSENYSNARYFLGLIYDRQGKRQDAIAQFEKILALNSDHQEVTRILENLRAGKSALAGIVPPLPAPERRTQVPVPDSGGAN
jgi:tetratricopeptide (TPR) repeat protein